MTECSVGYASFLLWPVFRVLFAYFIPGDAQSLGYAFAVFDVGFRAVADVAEFDLHWDVAHGMGCVFKQHLLLIRLHQAEQSPRL